MGDAADGRTFEFEWRVDRFVHVPRLLQFGGNSEGLEGLEAQAQHEARLHDPYLFEGVLPGAVLHIALADFRGLFARLNEGKHICQVAVVPD